MKRSKHRHSMSLWADSQGLAHRKMNDGFNDVVLYDERWMSGDWYQVEFTYSTPKMRRQ